MTIATTDGSAIVANGWRQGSILPAALGAHVQVVHDPTGASVPESWWVIASHDCDVAQPMLDREPCVDVVRAEAIVEADANKMHCKNPRELGIALAIPGKGNVPVLLRMTQRGVLPRALLLEHKPEATVLADGAVGTFRNWLARRYNRPAFANAFEQRLATEQKLYDKVRKALRKYTTDVIGVYVKFQGPLLEERPPGDPYILELRIVLNGDGSASDAVDTRNRLEDDVLAPILKLLKAAPDITLTSATLLFETEVSLHDQRMFRALDFDYLSIAADDNPGSELAH